MSAYTLKFAEKICPAVLTAGLLAPMALIHVGGQYGDLALDNAVYKGNDRVAEVCTLLKRPPGLMCKFEPVHDLLLLLLRRVMIADS
jgi:hypothetical protein